MTPSAIIEAAEVAVGSPSQRRARRPNDPVHDHRVDRGRRSGLDGLVVCFDKSDYRPLYLDDPTSDGVVRLRLAAFEHLPLTPANQGLLSLAAQHPNARVDTNAQHAPSN